MDRSAPVDVSVILATYNRQDALLLTLQALAAVDYPPDCWEVIVVDDGSTDDTRVVVAEWCRKCPVSMRFVEQSNAGPAAARNRGADLARGTYLIFIDNDILVEPDFVHAHLSTLRAFPGCWVVGRVVQTPRLRETPFGRFRDDLHERFHASFEADEPTETTWVTTQNLSMPAADFRRLNGFDEGFTIASSEDWELAHRARQTGVRLLYDPRISVLHNDWAGTLSSFCERQRLYAASDVLLWRKYGSESPRERLVLENASPQWGRDPLPLIAKKLAKRTMERQPLRFALHSICHLVERVLPDRPLTRSLYHLAIGVAIHRGVRQGLLQYAGPPRIGAAPGHTETTSDSPALPRVSVVLPTYNRSAVLLRVLTALSRVDYPSDRWEVIVVDDGSSDNTPDVVREGKLANDIVVHYVRQPNAGPGAARNRGAQVATGEYLVFLDSDILVAPDFLRAHVSALLAHPGCWIAGRITHREALRSTPFGRYRDQVWERFHNESDGTSIAETPLGSAANLSMPAADLARLSGFDETFTIASCEDWDLGIRARASGIRILYHPGLVGFHEDWAVDLSGFCQRQRLYSLSDVLLWKKYGDHSPRVRVVRENGPIDWGHDRPGLIGKKFLKSVLSTRPGVALVRGTASLVERGLPDTFLARRAYEVAVALAIFRGVREGLQEQSTAGIPAAPVPATGR